MSKSKGLVIVESPAKARTLSQFLEGRYVVKASLGHVRDLPKSKLGVEVSHDFAPSYEVPKEKKKVVKELTEAARGVPQVFLATDPDREGEAISWHLTQAAHLDNPQRVVFHEITKEAVQEAFRHPRPIDMRLVNAQQGRRILDRLVGYKISPILWQKIRKGLSAGRVQSVALRMIVEREREIKGFVSQEYWSIEAELAKKAASKSKVQKFRAALVGYLEGKKKLKITHQEEAGKLVAVLEKAAYAVGGVNRKESLRQPAPPFITSTLQQEAWRKLGFVAKRTMAIAQQLYEGLPIGSETVGLITYMRTDSTRVSTQALAETRDYIAEKYGQDFLPPSARQFTRKVKGAQEAHEAIRPTSVKREPSVLKAHLTSEQFRLYELIWKRMVASQMAPGRLQTTTVEVTARTPKEGYLFRVASTKVLFPGFLTLYSEGKDEDGSEEEGKKLLPEVKTGDPLDLLGLFPEQHFTQPPPRYTDASLVKALEENGIGRPSTYAPIISTLQEREYVERVERHLQPKDLGFLVSDIMTQHFAQIVDIDFTARMEEGLDQVARGERDWVPMLREFYDPFEETLKKASQDIQRLGGEPTDQVCEVCGRPMVIKLGRFGKFLSCSGYPECTNRRPLVVSLGAQRIGGEPTDQVCEVCGRPMVIKWGRFGKFLSCSGYPECTNRKSLVVNLGVRCPRCGGDLLERHTRKGRTFFGCSHYPECDFSLWQRPLPQPCPECGGLLVAERRKTHCLKCAYVGSGEEVATPA
ncbi:MAG: type I DNA topoisomerase [Chloroflexota bacterium]|nr:type I DNA topoisomerase [Chloroflexota bacterium]